MPEQQAIAIRPYRPEDLDALIALFRDSVRKVARRDYTEEQVRIWAPDDIDRAAWRERRERKPNWVAVLGEQPVGFTDLEPDGHIDMFFVHADCQGLGIGRRLIETIEKAARAQGLGRLYTEASLTAHGFFTRQGFTTIAQQTVNLKGVDFINFRMEKRLA